MERPQKPAPAPRAVSCSVNAKLGRQHGDGARGQRHRQGRVHWLRLGLSCLGPAAWSVGHETQKVERKLCLSACFLARSLTPSSLAPPIRHANCETTKRETIHILMASFKCHRNHANVSRDGFRHQTPVPDACQNASEGVVRVSQPHSDTSDRIRQFRWSHMRMTFVIEATPDPWRRHLRGTS